MKNNPVKAERQVALLDWDQSLREGFVLFDFVRELTEDGLFSSSEWKRIGETLGAYERGEIRYSTLAQRATILYAQGLHGQAVRDVRKTAERFVEDDLQDNPRRYWFATAIFNLLRRQDIEAHVVSGSPEVAMQVYSAHFSFETLTALTIEERSGIYAGRIVLNPALRSIKNQIAGRLSKNAEVAVAIGDSESDLPLLQRARRRVVIDGVDLLPADDGTTLHLRGATLQSDRTIRSVERFLEGV